MYKKNLIYQKLSFFSALLSILCVMAHGSNTAPIINAGADQLNVGTKDAPYLIGRAEDDSTPAESLIVYWKQITGKTATISDSLSLMTKVTYPDSGKYSFVLTVSDRVNAVSDTVNVKVHISLPFKILVPLANSLILINLSTKIKWQMEPSIPCNVYLSMDNGKNWNKLSLIRSVSDSFEWIPDSTILSGTQGIIKVEEYQKPENYVTVSIVFTNELPLNPSEKKTKSGCGTGAGLALLPVMGARFITFGKKRRRNRSC